MTSPEFDGIAVKGAREHNLKNVDVSIPRNQITVITGLSGSGKSSIAFDTIYAEGQRRYVEGLSAYARNFLEQLKKPDVDSITGLSPAIAIDQKSVGTNPRSTVGTVTEVYDFLRLLYAKVGVPQCPVHHIPVESQSPQQIIEAVLQLPENSKLYILAPMAVAKKGEFFNEFQKWLKKGFIRAKIDGQFVELEKAKKLAKTKTHDIDLVIDKLVLKSDLRRRLSESISMALSLTNGHVVIELFDGQRLNFSIHSACPQCGFNFPEIEPRFFSFNNPRGACPTCHGLGTIDVEEHEQFSDNHDNRKLISVKYSFRGENTRADFSEEEPDPLDFVELNACPTCHGARLRQEALNVFIDQFTIADLTRMSAQKLRESLRSVRWTERNKVIGEKILQQILARLDYMIRVGTGYLSLDRSTRTLSGGESQRIRLASQVGSSLVGVLYVLDEPSIGLHPRDHARLLEILRDLREIGNTILMVEHDEDTIRSADHIIDLGPRAGVLGGTITALGTPKEVEKNPASLTGQYLSGRLKIRTPTQRRTGNNKALLLSGASGNNLKNVDLKIPLGTFTSVTGVSGSGKSTLIIDTLYKILAKSFYKSNVTPSPFQEFSGIEHLDKVVEINQKPIGRTPRSNPATYIGLLPMIRDLYARLPESRMRGYKPGRFSFNVKGGRCENCQGAGMIKVEMHFMSDVYVQCDVCLGKRYNRETLNIKYKDKSIADVLAMSVVEALEFFKNHSLIHRKIDTLNRVGLDYITLGQSSTTLSGGEAQRIKLSRELSKRGTGQTLYILDEPTTGLHFADVEKLIELLQELVTQGNTVVIIEHNMDVIKSSDYVIDLGPEGGEDGGYILGAGTPEQIAKIQNSHTARYLSRVL